MFRFRWAIRSDVVVEKLAIGSESVQVTKKWPNKSSGCFEKGLN